MKKVIIVFLLMVLSGEVGAIYSLFYLSPKPKVVYYPIVNERLAYIIPDQPKEQATTVSDYTEEIHKLILSTKSNAVIQGINPNHIKRIISSVLSYLGESDIKSWSDLILITAQIESNMGRLLKQTRGPALGIFQMEPETEKSIWKNYLPKNKSLMDKISSLKTNSGFHNELEYNIAYAVAMTYTLYKWRKVDPSKMNSTQLIEAYKKKYNTPKGKTKVLTAIRNVAYSGILSN